VLCGFTMSASRALKSIDRLCGCLRCLGRRDARTKRTLPELRRMRVGLMGHPPIGALLSALRWRQDNGPALGLSV